MMLVASDTGSIGAPPSYSRAMLSSADRGLVDQVHNHVATRGRDDLLEREC